MSVRNGLLWLLLALIGAFLALNWPAVLASSNLNLLVAEIQLPIGLVMLAMMLLMLGFFVIYVLYLQAHVMWDARGHAKELQNHRKLVDEAEASRFVELRQFLSDELGQLRQQDQLRQAEVLNRLTQLEEALRKEVQESDNAIVATLAEMDDRQRSAG